MTKYSLCDNVLVQKVSDEMVLLDLDAGEYYGLNDVGTRVIEMLEEGRETAEILADLEQSYDVAAEVLERDVTTLLGELVENGLIRAG